MKFTIAYAGNPLSVDDLREIERNFTAPVPVRCKDSDHVMGSMTAVAVVEGNPPSLIAEIVLFDGGEGQVSEIYAYRRRETEMEDFE
jgi:hypothetical protein